MALSLVTENTFGVSVLNTPVGGSAVAANSNVTLTGIKPFPFRDIVNFSRTQFSLGVLGAIDIQFGAFVPTPGEAYKIIYALNLIPTGTLEVPREPTSTYISIAATNVLADLLNQFATQINNDITLPLTASVVGTELRATMDNFSIDGFSVRQAPFASNVFTAYVRPNGSPAQVSQAAPYATVPITGEYDRFEVFVDARSTGATGAMQASHEKCIVFADINAAGFAAFLTALTTIVDGSGTNAQYDAVV